MYIIISIGKKALSKNPYPFVIEIDHYKVKIECLDEGHHKIITQI